MSQLLLSIKPIYINSIFSGSKLYEYRKFRCRDGIDTIIFYATAPIKLVVGEAKIETIIEGDPQEVWRLTEEFSGIDQSFFDIYYKDKIIAFAYKLTNIKEYSKPFSLKKLGVSSAPQSYCYIQGASDLWKKYY